MNSIHIPKDTHIILFDAIIHEFDSILAIVPLLMFVKHIFFGLHFYLIILTGAKIAFDNLLPIEYQIDSKLSMLSYHSKIMIYGYSGMKFANQDTQFGTNIQSLNCSTYNIIKEINNIKKTYQ